MLNLIPYTLFGSTIAFLIFIAIVLIISIVAELNDNGYPIIIAIIVLLLFNHFWGDFPVMYYCTWQNALAYIGIGFLYALLRVYFLGLKMSPADKKRYDLRTTVLRYWAWWWISLVAWILGDILINIGDKVYTISGKIFEHIFTLHDKDVNSNAERPNSTDIEFKGRNKK